MKYTVFALTAVFIVGCSGDESAEVTRSAQSEEERAVAAFRELAQEVTERAATPFEAVCWEVSEWEAVRVTVDDLDYDVVRTESLLAPLQGEICVTISEAQYNGQSEDSAVSALSAGDGADFHSTEQLTVLYEWRDGRWQTDSTLATTCYPFANSLPILNDARDVRRISQR